MIEAASDKSPCWGELGMSGQQCPSAPAKWNTKNKFVPRTRKEKCQTPALPCRNRRLSTQYDELFGAVCSRERAFWQLKLAWWRSSRLTLLTPPVRNVRPASGPRLGPSHHKPIKYSSSLETGCFVGYMVRRLRQRGGGAGITFEVRPSSVLETTHCTMSVSSCVGAKERQQ
jgi:hypothetical protein